MMTSSNGNIFRVTGHLCGEFTGHRWIPRTKASDAELWCFLLICARINGWVNNGEAGDLRRHRAHSDVIVMMGPEKVIILLADVLASKEARLLVCIVLVAKLDIFCSISLRSNYSVLTLRRLSIYIHVGRSALKAMKKYEAVGLRIFCLLIRI